MTEENVVIEEEIIIPSDNNITSSLDRLNGILSSLLLSSSREIRLDANTIDPPSLTDWSIDSFRQMIRGIHRLITQSDSNIHVYLPLKCQDIRHSFVTNEALFRYERAVDSLTVEIFYQVFHTAKKKEFTHTHSFLSVSDINNLVDQLVDFIIGIYFKRVLCPECLKLIDSADELCHYCSFHKLRNEYAIERQWMTDGIDMNADCCICQNPVYNTRLKCGHPIHHTCLIQLSPFQWFYSDTTETRKLKCPMCRQPLTEYDINRYFKCR